MTFRPLPYGYKRNSAGNIDIVQKEAMYVKIIFEMYVEGSSQNSIAEWLIKNNVVKRNGLPNWNDGDVSRLLKNSKYIGDGEFQTIVDKLIFDKVVARRLKHKPVNEIITHPTPKYFFSNKLVCVKCGSYLTRVYLQHNKTSKYAWRCNKYIVDSKVKCRKLTLRTESIEQAFIEVLHHLKKHFNSIMPTNHFTSAYNEDIKATDSLINRELEKAIVDPIVVNELLVKRTTQIWEITEVNDFAYYTKKLKSVIDEIDTIPQVFDEELFSKIIKYVTLLDEGRVSFVLKNNVSINWKYKI